MFNVKSAFLQGASAQQVAIENPDFWSLMGFI
jgi:hypothetical protein